MADDEVAALVCDNGSGMVTLGGDGGTRPHPLRPEGALKGAVSDWRDLKVKGNRLSSIRGHLRMQNHRLLLVAVVRFVVSPMHQAAKGVELAR